MDDLIAIFALLLGIFNYFQQKQLAKQQIVLAPAQSYRIEVIIEFHKKVCSILDELNLFNEWIYLDKKVIGGIITDIDIDSLISGILSNNIDLSKYWTRYRLFFNSNTNFQIERYFHPSSSAEFIELISNYKKEDGQFIETELLTMESYHFLYEQGLNRVVSEQIQQLNEIEKTVFANLGIEQLV